MPQSNGESSNKNNAVFMEMAKYSADDFKACTVTVRKKFLIRSRIFIFRNLGLRRRLRPTRLPRATTAVFKRASARFVATGPGGSTTGYSLAKGARDFSR